MCFPADATVNQIPESKKDQATTKQVETFAVDDSDSDCDVVFVPVCTSKPARAAPALADMPSVACTGDASEGTARPDADSEIEKLQAEFADLVRRARRRNIRVTVKSMCFSLECEHATLSTFV